jgi:hypothetical protein
MHIPTAFHPKETWSEKKGRVSLFLLACNNPNRFLTSLAEMGKGGEQTNIMNTCVLSFYLYFIVPFSDHARLKLQVILKVPDDVLCVPVLFGL